MANKIIIFTMDGCIHCKSLKKRLRVDSIPYVEVDIDNNQDLWNDVVNQTGHNVVPSIYIQKDENENGPIYIPGKDFEDEDEIVKIIRTYI